MLSKIYSWLENWKPDIVHLHSIHPLLKIGKIISKRYNSKFIMTIHGWDFDVGIKKYKIRQSILEITNKIDGMCVVNKSHLNVAKNFIKENKTSYIPCHLDIKENDKREIEKFDFTLKNLKLLFPANPSRTEKNYPLFLMTIKVLEKRGWKIESDFLNNLSRSKTIQKFHWADLILVTSKREGGPLVTKEAIYCGTRVVSTPVGDTIEWLPQNSISSQYTPQELAKSVENALNNSPHIWKIPKKFKKESVLKKLIDLYHIN